MNVYTNSLLISSSKGTAWLLTWSLQALALLACVWLGLKLFRAKSPAIRHQVWLFGLIAISLLPFWALLVDQFPLPMPISQPVYQIVNYAVEVPGVGITPDHSLVVQSVPAAPAFRDSFERVLLSLTFILWLIGAAVALARAVSQYMRLRSIRINAEPVALAHLGCGDFALGRASIRLSLEIASPLTFGVLHPVILLPADFAGWANAEERRAIIRHELAHIQRRDTLINLFQNALHAVFYFHPMVRYASRQLSLEREMACDDRVLGAGSNAESYADSLLKVAERSISSAWTPSGTHDLALISGNRSSKGESR